MKLTVDASIAVKWFVAEHLGDEARVVLVRRIQRYAPDLLLAECANTIWKKAQRGELPDAQAYREELANLPDIVTLYPDRSLIERATQIAFEITHPIHDCFYLACAEATVSDLVTADKCFVAKIGEGYPEARVHYVGAPGVAGWIETMGTAPVIKQDKVDALAVAYEVLARTELSISGPLPGGTTDKDWERSLATPSWRRLANLIRKLNDEEMIDLLACGWLGAGLYPTWRQSFDHAERLFAALDPSDAARYGGHWQSGHTRAMAEVEAVQLAQG